jgi:hypothetical protein
VIGDEIRLVLPRERSYYRIAELVLGGVAARHEVTLEHLEDLELALEGLLERLDGEGQAVVRLRIEDDSLRAAVGPFDERLSGELEREAGNAIGLRRLLDAVVDGYEIVDADGEHWVELTKAVR